MKTTKIFFDCEFTGLHKETTLISIGLISECGKTFYSECTDYTRSQVNSWVKKNVISKLKFRCPSSSRQIKRFQDIDGNIEFCGESYHMREKLRNWLSQFENVEMWSDCLSYKWILFNDIFQVAISDMPKNVYHIPFDICTFFKIKGIDPDISREEFAKEGCSIWFAEEEKHNALFDAKIIKMCYEKLIKMEEK